MLSFRNMSLISRMSFQNTCNFPNENAASSLPPTEEELLKMLRTGRIDFPPARLQLLVANTPHPQEAGFDGVLQITWQSVQATYAFEYKRASNPRSQEEAVARAVLSAQRVALHPLIIVPYLSEQSLLQLEAINVSGFDLCGNGIILNPHFRLWRTGYPNRYKDSRPIRNPFRGDSSVFARAFLLRNSFPSVSELQAFVHERTFGSFSSEPGIGLTQGTASKIVQALEQELIVNRVGGEIKLLDAPRLMQRLRRHYIAPASARMSGTTPLVPQSIWDTLSNAGQNGLRAVTTGIGSAGKYKLLSGVDRQSIYVDNLQRAVEILQVRPGNAFSNIELLECRKNIVYFDARKDGSIVWASPIQTWVELATSGPREQEVAQQLESMLLTGNGANVQ
jgi:hypothetical protein